MRPQYVLHTNVFVSQDDWLTEGDLTAAWEVLWGLESKHVIIYNCGVEGGSSVGHKHMQLLPLCEDDGFRLWPDKLGFNDGWFYSLSNSIKS